MVNLAEEIEHSINFKNPLIYLSGMHIMFNVLYWNITSRIQYKTNFFSKLFGNKKTAIYIHTILIFSFGLSRDYLYKYVVSTSGVFSLIDNQYMTYLGYLILFLGSTLVLSATYKLGIVGTFNGDAYGFLLPSIITSFPFNLFNAPMYLGSTLNFLGYAILKKSFVGLILTLLVALCYYFGTFFEDKLTHEIYSKALSDDKTYKAKKAV